MADNTGGQLYSYNGQPYLWPSNNNADNTGGQKYSDQGAPWPSPYPVSAAMPGYPLKSVGGIITAVASLSGATALKDPATAKYLYWDTINNRMIESSTVPV